MNLLGSLGDFFNNSVFKEIRELIVAYFPPDMTPQQRAEFELKVADQLNQKQLEVNNAINDAAAQLDQRIKEQEGTASDLKAMPILGTLVLFLRGLQRPLWGYATLYLDIVWLFKVERLTPTQEHTLTIINFLVLGFLFGERTLKNLEPLLVKLFGKDRE